jgi:hypothetical protein
VKSEDHGHVAALGFEHQGRREVVQVPDEHDVRADLLEKLGETSVDDLAPVAIAAVWDVDKAELDAPIIRVALV